MGTRKPIRTYQRKIVKNSFVGLSALPVRTIKKYDPVENVQTRLDKSGTFIDESLNYDPFETTFDRLAKDAIVPPLPPDANRHDSSNRGSSESDTSNVTNIKSPEHDAFTLFADNGASSLMHKSVKLGRRCNRSRKSKLNAPTSKTKAEQQKRQASKMQKRSKMAQNISNEPDNKCDEQRPRSKRDTTSRLKNAVYDESDVLHHSCKKILKTDEVTTTLQTMVDGFVTDLKCVSNKLSLGKGRKWRNSVRDLLDMQKQGIVQSCCEKQKDDLPSPDVSNRSSFDIDRHETFNSTNHVRFSKRISVRVVPNDTSVNHEVKDVPFLEAFGINSKLSQGKELVNGEPQKKFNEILSEIVIAQTGGFVEVKNIKCIIGTYPKKLVKLWNAYDEEKTSDNDCPSMFDKNQLYIALELGHGGEDLEAFVFQTADETCALFFQIAFALAVAERALEFEHRDLHWGNVLISKTTDKYIYYKLDEKEIRLLSNGVRVSIIDFTLSRMLYQQCCIYNDLALDPALFTAHGEYQFEIYRLMRDKLQNNWREFEPYTNILWLHYILDKMITMVRYKRKDLRIHDYSIGRLKELKNLILNYDSTYDFVTNYNDIPCRCF
ncbi:hypothetical protein DMN91_012404 [Ooceraea biroi]|uniref:non-specific serine/threonine protein kinase n=1 Tax=Ooceraea biroi TaxID=2015173 RepID=A0A3L8D4U2_OOCBI|nr:hypothetical protein DMN91_012404 [Ooceraea biroi]